jgi:hypothetical protein
VMLPAARVTNPNLTSFVAVNPQLTPSGDGKVWTGSWFLNDAPNGTYSIVFTAIREGLLQTQASVITVQRSSTTTNETTTPTPTVTSLAVSWMSPSASSSVVAGVTDLRVATVGEPSSVGFRLTGPNNIEQRLPATLTGAGVFAFFWNTALLPNGTYALHAIAERNGTTVTAAEQRTVIVNNATATTTEPEETGTETSDDDADETTTSAPAPTVQPFTATIVAPIAGTVAAATQEVLIRTSLAARSVSMYVAGASTTASAAATQLPTTFAQDRGMWVASWRTTGLNAGEYRISVLATGVDGRTADTSAIVKVAAAAPVVTEEPKTIAPVVAVRIDEPRGATVSGSVKLIATAEGAPDTVTFLVRSTAPGSQEISRKASFIGSGRWSATLVDGSLPAGAYVMVASAVKGSVTASSAPAQFTLASTVKPAETVPTATETATALPLQAALVTPNGGSVQGIVTFSAKVNKIAKGLRFAVIPDGTDREIVSFVAAPKDGGLWVAIWNSTTVADGTYRVFAEAADETTSARSAMVTIGVLNAQKPTAFMAEVPVEAVKQAVQELPAGTQPIAMVVAPPVPKEVAEVATQRIAAECVERGIPAEKCGAWLASQPSECRAAGITTKEECLAWLKKQAGGDLPECRGADAARCAEIEQRKTAGLLSDDQLKRIDAAVTGHINTVISLKVAEGTNAVEAASVADPAKPVEQDFAAVIPLRPTEKKELALRVHASPAYVKTSDEESARRVPAVLLIDTDEDGLPDDVEKRFGTDPLLADTDGDGFDDGMELKNGFNPLGPGKLGAEEKPIAPIDAAIVAGLPIEQPTEAGEVSEDLSIESVANEVVTEETDAEEAALRFAGTGVPGEVITIFVYSYLPIVLTTTVGEDGTWAYDLEGTLADGQHEAYVTVTDETGKIQKKSSPLSFFVAEARAATEGEYFGPNADLVSVAEAPVADLYKYYALGALALILVAAVLGVLIFRQPKRDAMTE